MYKTNITGYYIIKFNGKHIRKSNIIKLYKFLKYCMDKDNTDNN